MKNPFPGMNPWMEEWWRDVHARILVNAPPLPDDEAAQARDILARPGDPR